MNDTGGSRQVLGAETLRKRNQIGCLAIWEAYCWGAALFSVGYQKTHMNVLHHESQFYKWTCGPLFYRALPLLAGLVGKVRAMSKTSREDLIILIITAQCWSGFLSVSRWHVFEVQDRQGLAGALGERSTLRRSPEKDIEEGGTKGRHVSWGENSKGGRWEVTGHRQTVGGKPV